MNIAHISHKEGYHFPMNDHSSGRAPIPTLQFLGATETVTGSKFLLRIGDHNHLIDCGLFQGHKELRLRNRAPFPVNPKDISSVILTHAHIDHTGAIPLLIKNHFHGRIYASEPTYDLCKILLPDAGHIQEEDAKFATRKGFSKHRTPEPLYTYEDAMRSLAYFRSVHNGDLNKLDDFDFRYIKAGHILGSRFIDLTIHHPRQRKILFGGDIGRYDSIVASPPLRVPETDYLILESTYGDQVHPKEDVYAKLARIINETVARRGKVIIPAFAVGRTQELLYIVQKLQRKRMIDGNLPVYLNTPMGISATDIYARYLDEHRVFSGLNGELQPGRNPFHCENLHLVKEHGASKALNELEDPAIIIAGSGMLTGGRILHHLKHYAPDPNSTLVMVGFQSDGTRGRAILDGASHIKIHGEQVPIRCNVEVMTSLSAHGDQEDILQWLDGFRRPPTKTYLVHGERDAANELAAAIHEKLQWEVQVPQYRQVVELV